MDTFWKDKTIVAYIALKHHTRFIAPILKEIEKKGGSVFYIVGQAERSQEITAIELGLDYQHIFDFLTDDDLEEVSLNYQIMREGFKKALLENIEYDAQVSTVMDKTFYATAQEFVGFKNYFNKIKPDLCIALHEVNRWGKLFSHHAKKNNIPFISLQEGLFSITELSFGSIGHIQNSTLGLLWGQGSKSFLCDFETPRERAFLVGNTHLANEIKQLKENKVRETKRIEYKITDKFTALLCFSSTIHPYLEFLPVFDAFASDDHKSLFVKFHPATTRFMIDKWINQIPANYKRNCHFIHGEENTYNMIAMSDICIFSDTSTVALEALAIGKPVFFLALKTPKAMKSLVPEKKAALEFTPEKFKELLQANTDFSSLVAPEHVHKYLEDEVCDPEKSIDLTIDIMKKVILANKDAEPPALHSNQSLNKKWSVIMPVFDRPDIFLPLLESFSANSGDHDYEVFFIRPPSVSSDTEKILESLEGDVIFLQTEMDGSYFDTMNTAAVTARGETLVFFGETITPSASWIDALEKAIKQHGSEKIYGGKIVNPYGNIVHAGMILNSNHSVVSAYEHLDAQFPQANKERPFQMVDGFAAADKNFFLSTGGFNTKAGRYAFMDLCLRVQKIFNDPDAVYYIPKIELIQLIQPDRYKADKDALYFYSKWHASLWDNENEFYKLDGVSQLQLDAARMTRAIATASYGE